MTTVLTFPNQGTLSVPTEKLLKIPYFEGLLSGRFDFQEGIEIQLNKDAFIVYLDLITKKENEFYKELHKTAPILFADIVDMSLYFGDMDTSKKMAVYLRGMPNQTALLNLAKISAIQKLDLQDTVTAFFSTRDLSDLKQDIVLVENLGLLDKDPRMYGYIVENQNYISPEEVSRLTSLIPKDILNESLSLMPLNFVYNPTIKLESYFTSINTKSTGLNLITSKKYLAWSKDNNYEIIKYTFKDENRGVYLSDKQKNPPITNFIYLNRLSTPVDIKTLPENVQTALENSNFIQHNNYYPSVYVYEISKDMNNDKVLDMNIEEISFEKVWVSTRGGGNYTIKYDYDKNYPGYRVIYPAGQVLSWVSIAFIGREKLLTGVYIHDYHLEGGKILSKNEKPIIIHIRAESVKLVKKEPNYTIEFTLSPENVVFLNQVVEESLTLVKSSPFYRGTKFLNPVINNQIVVSSIYSAPEYLRKDVLLEISVEYENVSFKFSYKNYLEYIVHT